MASTGWTAHTVRLINGRSGEIVVPGRKHIVTESWNQVVAVPYIVYMPEKGRILMLIGHGYPHQPMVLFSDDLGATWSDPVYVKSERDRKKDTGFQIGVGLSYIGDGVVMMGIEGAAHWISRDFGETWSFLSAVPPAPNGRSFNQWMPVLVDRDRQTGRIVRLVETRYWCTGETQSGGHARGAIAFSEDEGRTWSEPLEVPQWDGVNEVSMCRARNGDIVGACRTVVPEQYKLEVDHYEGLGVSISKDSGYTWSELDMLYHWGRHQTALIVLAGGDIVMTYVVRKGYTPDSDGLPRFGVEAVVSRDNGRSWDLDHRYVLDTWKGFTTQKGREWYGAPLNTSTVLLPDGSMLTAFETGYRAGPDPNSKWYAPRDVELVQWSLSDQALDSDRTISDAAFDSDTRNVWDPTLRKPSIA